MKRKNIFLIIALFIIIIIVITISFRTSLKEENIFNEYNKKMEYSVDNFNANKDNLKTVEKDVLAMSTEGGSIIGYFLDNECKHIDVILYGELGKTSIKYYLESDYTIIQKEEKYYTQPIYFEDELTESDSILEQLIMVNGKLFKFDYTKAELVEVHDVDNYKKDIEEFKDLLIN